MTARQLNRTAFWQPPKDDDTFTLLAEGTRWQDLALCAQTDPESFFVGKGEPTAPAKKVCMACPVRTECLEYALENNENHGVWGGLSERQRRKLKKDAAA